MTGSLEAYYRVHSVIYDATRWSFLFGRQTIVDLAAAGGPAERILEIGCGTGRNLTALGRAFPGASVTGVDLSAAMLRVAAKKGSGATLVCRAYDRPLAADRPFDLILCSYALTMFNPGWEEALDCAAADLRPGGRLVLADFHDSPSPLFRRWMAVNHVRLEGHLLPRLERLFEPQTRQIRRAYGGLWRYLLFIGRRRP